MNNNLQKLEFNKILDILSSFCVTDNGKKLALELLPSNSSMEVKKLLAETEEAVNLSYRNSFPSFYEFSDISYSIKSLQNGSTLNCPAILNLNTILKTANELKNYFNKDFIDITEYPILAELFNSLYSNINIIETIDKSIIDEFTISDDASPELKSIRRKQKSLEQDIRKTLNNIIHSSNSKYLQDNIITIRNDRFVIPVKEEYRSQIKGFVHDVSNAGSTLFIEPISIFEMNNKIAELKSKEEIEIEKILQKLSFLFEPYTDELILDTEIISKLDFIFAKARYSKLINGITPKINENKFINLISARHPLIDKSQVVPMSINLGSDFSTLLITGPNTGGKTVTLKTIGLLSCMACSGLNIPADEHSSIYVFDEIYTDIGDDQSISDSLSTFSSHMTNIVEITKKVTQNSLVLVDELGSGTDPIEGANLAISILEFFKNKKCITIATTHYQELKQYALVTNDFENASVEFDVNTLSPTYKLLVGIPGKSNAFAISKKLGLSDNIINKAKSLMSSDAVNIEELLKTIYDDKSLIEKEKEEIQKQLNQINLLRKSLERDNSLLKQQELDLINNAKIKARNILLDAKEEATNIIKQLNNSKDSNQINALRNKLNTDIKNIKITNSKNSSKEHIPYEEIKPNMEVYIPTFNKNGIILSHVNKSNEVQVQIGNIKTNININNIEKISISNKTNETSNTNLGYTKISKTKNIKSEINVIGLNVEEAIFVVDKFLDDCSLAKLQNVRIVHGKGTGKLRTGIHSFLKNNPHVKSFRLGTYGEGEMGVTVVELKK